MAKFAFSVNRVTILGSCYGGAEEWSTGFFIGLPTADASNPTQQLADSIRTAWGTFFGNPTSKIAGTFQTRSIKISQLRADGTTFLDNTIFSDFATPVSGSSVGTSLPPQCSLVVTLQSSLSRGLAAKGRMFLPGVNAILGSNGQVSSSDTQGIANNMKTFLDAVNVAAGSPQTVILASHGRGVLGTGAANAKVTRVRVGSVYDTQRRRRNGMIESYTSANLA